MRTAPSSPILERKMRADVDFAARNVTADLPSYSTGIVTLLKFVSLGLIIAFGSAGNSLVIYAFGRYLRLRRSPYILMLGFVFLDLLRIFVCFPIIFVTVVHRLQWRYGADVCQLMAFANVFCLLGNSLGIFGMALDRYVDNKHRALYRRKFRGSLGTAMLLLIWGMAFIFAFPTVYTGSSHDYLPVEAQCTYPHHYYSSDVDTLGLMASLTSVLILTNVLYVRLFLFLRGRRRMRPVIYEPAVSENWGFFDNRGGVSVRRRWLAHSLSEAPIAVVSRNIFQNHPIPTNYEMALWRSRKQKDNEKLTKLCFAIHIIFTIMWLPYITVCFMFAFEYRQKTIPEWVEVSATWLTYLQVSVTPLAFFSLSGFTRRKFRILNGKRRFSPTLSNSST